MQRTDIKSTVVGPCPVSSPGDHSVFDAYLFCKQEIQLGY